MKTIARNPRQWRLSTLLALGTEQVHKLACQVVKANTSFRVILGRCLLALHENKGYKKFGCSSATHYGLSKLGISERTARDCKRVARELQELPVLTVAAENGDITWSKLRLVVGVASLETEKFWLEMSKRHTVKQLRQLKKVTPKGGLPGDADVEKSCTTEFRIVTNPEAIQLFRRARRMLSLEQGKALTGAETLELLLANFFSTQPMDTEILEQLKAEADLDLRAERAQMLPEVLEARELAAELVTSEDAVVEEESPEELLERAVGGPVSACCSGGESDCCSGHQKRNTCDVERLRNGHALNAVACVPLTGNELFAQLKTELEAWKNNRTRYNPLTRLATPAQKKELYRRDGWQCSTPGCPHQVWLHVHHIRPYSEGGTTTRENLICLCTACHSNLHDGLLRIEVLENGKLRFTDQDGQRLDIQTEAELAHWLDFFFGWRGTEDDSLLLRHARGEWTIFGT